MTTANTPNIKLLLTVKEAAELTGYGEDLIKQECEGGKIKVFRLFSRKNFKIPFIQLNEWISNNTTSLRGEE